MGSNRNLFFDFRPQRPAPYSAKTLPSPSKKSKLAIAHASQQIQQELNIDQLVQGSRGKSGEDAG